MASIERTAYPRYNRFLTPHEIQTQSGFRASTRYSHVD